MSVSLNGIKISFHLIYCHLLRSLGLGVDPSQDTTERHEHTSMTQAEFELVTTMRVANSSRPLDGRK